MNVLIGCEISGVVRDAFRKAGHNAWSCDLQKSDSQYHISIDIFHAVTHPFQYCDALVWDLIICHPPCTALAVSGNGTYAKGKAKHAKRLEAIRWTINLWHTCIENSKRVCFENPRSVIFPYLRNGYAKVQYIQPWQFGHPETKSTGLALYNLPFLTETNNVKDYMDTLPAKEKHKTWYMSPSDDRGQKRSETFQGIADAFVGQWG